MKDGMSRPVEGHPEARGRYLLPAAIAAATATLYLPTFRWMYGRYTAPDSYYSHGFLVPLISAYLVWRKREELGRDGDDYSWWGLALLFFALLLHLLSVHVGSPAASALSLVPLVFGVPLFLLGTGDTRRIFFPLLFLLFMIPMPDSVINLAAYPLKLVAALAGTSLVNLLGVPAYLSGFHIETAGGTLLVDDPCSGLRSLITFMALGSLLGYLSRGRVHRRVLLFLSSIPIALVTNILRIVFLTLLTSFRGPAAASPGSPAHDVSGYALFLAGALMLFVVEKGTGWKG